MKLPTEQIVVDDELYPRNQMDWMTAYRYADAMRAGAIFPPVIVGKRGKFFVLLDGRHRLEAHRRNKLKHISTLVSRVSPAHFLLEAVRLNAANGRALSIQERIQASERLKQAGFAPAQIAKALFMPIESLQRLTVDRLIRPPQIKGGLALVRKAPVTDGLAKEEDQRSLAASSVLSILQQAIACFEHGWVDLADNSIQVAVGRLARVLSQTRRTARKSA